MKSDEWRAGYAAAIAEVEEESRDLNEIADSYIDAKRTGVFSGRKIRPEWADRFAKGFKERSDALSIMADYMRRQLDKENENGPTPAKAK